MNVHPGMDVVLVSKDLLVGSQLSAVAREFQRGFRQVNAMADPVILEPGLRILLIDLSQIDVAALNEFIPLVKSYAETVRILAFGPHVHGERLQSAIDAGCDLIAPRGGVVLQFRSWLSQ